MKRKKLILSAILLFTFGLTGLRAQNQLNVTGTSGTVSSFDLGGIAKLSFTGGNMVVYKTDGNSSPFAITDIRKLTFGPSTVGVKDLVSKAKSNVSLYPNPVTDELKITYESNTTRSWKVEILDMQGRVLHKEVILSPGGINHATIPVSQLGKGLYLCRMQYGDKSETVKFIKN